MITLGGWLFADLLLGLAMLFFTANTVDAPPPMPTPTATPDLLATEQSRAAAEIAILNATAEAQAAEIDLSSAQLATAAARATQDALARQQATATANALATRAAMSAQERATADAQATQDATAAEATIAAFATAQAADAANIDEITRQQAAAAAQATAESEAARATISALATNQAMQASQANVQATTAAEIAAIATSNAASGANALATAEARAAAAQATVDAVQASQSLSGSQLATARAEAAAIQQTVDALSAQQAAAQATATVLAAEVASSSLNPNSRQETIETDLNGMVSGDPDALDDARAALETALQEYPEGCRAGFVLISGNAPDVPAGVDLAQAVQQLLEDDFADIFGDDSLFETFALPGAEPTGQVVLQIFFFQGCQPTA